MSEGIELCPISGWFCVVDECTHCEEFLCVCDECGMPGNTISSGWFKQESSDQILCTSCHYSVGEKWDRDFGIEQETEHA